MTQRRRGQRLENALLDAAWAQLTEHGYTNFTLDAVARRANTSTPVIYRRWHSKEKLIEAAAIHTSASRNFTIPDTGTLRGDLIAIMTLANENSADLLATMTALLGTFFSETGTTPAQLRELALGDRHSAAEIVLQRAVARGEVDPTKMTPRIISLPFDLYRHEVLTTLQAVPHDVINTIIDDIFLPLVRP